MPPLKVLGRRWGVANDDVVLALLPLVFHLVWTIVIPVRPWHLQGLGFEITLTVLP